MLSIWWSQLYNHRDSLAAAGLDADDQTLTIVQRSISIAPSVKGGTITRSVHGELNSDGSVGETIHRHQKNLLKLDLGEWVSIVSKTIPLTASGLYAVSTPWQKVAVALAGVLTTLWEKSKEKLDPSDASVLFALAKVDRLHTPPERIQEAYRKLFGEELADNHLDRSLQKLADRGIISRRGELVTVQERLVLKF